MPTLHFKGKTAFGFCPQEKVLKELKEYLIALVEFKAK